MYDLGFPLPAHSEDHSRLEARQSDGGESTMTVSALEVLPSQVVQRGLGVPKGLSLLEHFHWAQQFSNPLAADASEKLDDDLRSAIEFECGASAQEIDAFRGARWQEIEKLFKSTEGYRQQQWLEDNELSEDALGQQIKGAFI